MIWYFSNVILHFTCRIMYGGDRTEHFPPRIIDKSRSIWYFFNEILYFLPRTTYGAGQTKHLPPRTGHKSEPTRYILLSPKATLFVMLGSLYAFVKLQRVFYSINLTPKRNIGHMGSVSLPFLKTL